MEYYIIISLEKESRRESNNPSSSKPLGVVRRLDERFKDGGVQGDVEEQVQCASCK